MGGVVDKLAFPAPSDTDALNRRLAECGAATGRLTTLLTAQGDSFPLLHVGPADGEACVLYSHGNAEDLGEIDGWLRDIAATTGLPTFGYDYPGYGLARGPSPSERRCLSAAEAAYAHLSADGWKRIVLFGRSLGSGPAMHLATLHAADDVAALVLVSPLATGVGTILGVTLAATLRSIDVMRNIDLVSSVRCPTVVIHGTADAVVPCSHGRLLHQKLGSLAREPLWVRGRGHNDMPEDRVLGHVAAFLRGVGVHPSSR